MLIVGIIGVALGAGFIYLGRRQKGQQEKMAKTKVQPVAELQSGQVAEVYGQVISDHALTTPFSKRSCVYYDYELEKQVERRDNEGRPTREWENIAQDDERTSFWIKDKTGKIEVDPDGAEIDPEDAGERYVQERDVMDMPFFGEIRTSFGNQTRARERVLYTDTPAYVMGWVKESPDGLKLVKGQGSMIISHRTEAEIEKSKARSAVIWKVVGWIFGVGGLIVAIASFF